jgi:flagellar motor switch protein FliG
MSGAKTAVRKDALTGVQKSAVLCMALGPDGAARILQQLSADEVEEVSREIASMPAVDPAVVESVLEEFRTASQAAQSGARGGMGYASQVLEQALGAGRAKQVMGRVQEQVAEPSVRRLGRLPVDVLRGLLQGEHPQAVALVLAHLEPKRAAELANALPAELATDALARMARMDRIAPDVVSLVDETLSKRADPALSRPAAQGGGPGAVAKLLNFAGGANNDQLLEGLKARSSELAERVQALMFVFEDLLLVDGKGIQRVLREVDGKDLATALKGASAELKQHIVKNMSERAASALEEEMEILGPVRVKDVEAVHARIIELVRQLETAGEIMIRGRGGQDDVLV